MTTCIVLTGRIEETSGQLHVFFKWKACVVQIKATSHFNKGLGEIQLTLGVDPDGMVEMGFDPVGELECYLAFPHPSHPIDGARGSTVAGKQLFQALKDGYSPNKVSVLRSKNMRSCQSRRLGLLAR